MKYSNLKILNELGRIDKCITLSYTKEEGTEEIRKCIYRNDNSGLINHLVEARLVYMDKTYDENHIPFISPHGRDFLKKSWIRCLFEDCQGIIYFIAAIATIIGVFCA